MDERTRRNFLEKFSKNEHTEQEHELFTKWLKSIPEEELAPLLEEYGHFFKELADHEPMQHPELLSKIDARLDDLEADDNRNTSIQSKLSLRKVIAVAAAILLFLTVGIYIRKVSDKQQMAKNGASFNKISPGGNKAMLTLANGSKIILETAKKGLLANQRNSTVDKTADGKLVYNASNKQVNNQEPSSEYNTISTPNGGQYQVVLPDGTHVWLNAASSLKFPVAFAGKERNVELSGEAYFEVAKNKTMPFRVTVNHSVVEVLGTHFNIMGYTDEKSTNTTLLEGSVKVISGKDQKLIAPGEQARVNESIQVSKVNAAQAIEWKNGNFNFAHENIETIMRKVARWYNVSIQYQGPATHEGFVGTVPRSENITEVLNALELTGLVHFKIVERRVIVMP
ncbi:FecR family protein [Mucilaginibacter rubeus]|uniref:FecR family protein n=1 Tax=Mucilaginibacter rubeus TaxID=2027860 RepID=A0AAE6MKY9_9SPHI|nr:MULTISPECIES: FecR family protein [Mucilaginibacter]QEM07176.1 FecR family protein [Mucilaginibacter rubeus]QEM19632.1 FecR family protein [Mucilaginibacter gossypii]QTE43675.1 FecR family protein [Mucilaginibacter rubeus]QTE50275.1 FecR family protein [Mucilaginibacter rubeus]QTE55362.1 FecR family protein [Mucilaginibacter rubeus]